jgi:hypothetical protein
MNREKLWNVLFDKWLHVGVNTTLALMFGIATFYTTEWWAAVIMAWSCGAQCGFAMMWFVSPHISNRWRRQMEIEIQIMVQRAFIEATREARRNLDWAPAISPDDPFQNRSLN